MNKCIKCGKSLSSWSKFKDMQMKEDVVYATVGTIFNAIRHAFWGNSRHRSEGVDHWSEELYYCLDCKIYYIKCPKCGNLLPLSVMPTNGKTIVKCKKCGDTTLYAGDYDSGGG